MVCISIVVHYINLLYSGKIWQAFNLASAKKPYFRFGTSTLSLLWHKLSLIGDQFPVVYDRKLREGLGQAIFSGISSHLCPLLPCMCTCCTSMWDWACTRDYWPQSASPRERLISNMKFLPEESPCSLGSVLWTVHNCIRLYSHRLWLYILEWPANQPGSWGVKYWWNCIGDFFPDCQITKIKTTQIFPPYSTLQSVWCIYVITLMWTSCFRHWSDTSIDLQSE